MRKKHTGTLSLKGVGADDDLKKYIGRQIASIRKGSDLTARQVAERLKVSRETLTQIETGRNNPTALMLWKLACLFQCEVSDFFPQIPEGFGLTVSEGLWKGKPVIAGSVGGIPLQITHKYSGILTHSIEGTAFWLKQLLQSPEFAARLGQNGKEHVRQNFLLTRHMREYMLLFLSLDHPQEDVIHLS